MCWLSPEPSSRVQPSIEARGPFPPYARPSEYSGRADDNGKHDTIVNHGLFRITGSRCVVQCSAVDDQASRSSARRNPSDGPATCRRSGRPCRCASRRSARVCPGMVPVSRRSTSFASPVFLYRLADRLERLHAFEDRMRLGFRLDLHVAERPGVVVALVVAAEHFLVEIEPVLEGMAGGADADDRLARQAVLLDAFELFAGDLEAARVEHHDVAGVEVLQAGQIARRP